MKWRFYCVLFFFFTAFLLVTCKLFYWQIVKADELSELGQMQYAQHFEIVPKRGEIKTSDKFPLVTNKLSYIVYANTKEIKDKKYIENILPPLLGIDSASISASLSLDRFWISLKQNVDNTTKEKIAKFNLPGIGFDENFTRFYPEGSIAAQLVGFVGKDRFGNNKGYSGLEGYYDRQLKGRAGQIVEIRDALGRPVIAKLNTASGEQDGRNLILHVNRAIQFLVENTLRAGVEKYGAVGGTAIVMNPHTGGIIAMASVPSYDPRSYQDYEDDLYKVPSVSNLYEPGSTFKSIVMAAALDAHAIEPETQCPICAGPVSIGGYSIKTWNDKYIKNINMIDVLKNSDNTGMVFIEQSLGLDRMLSYLDKFGIGQTTGIDLQGEVTGELRSKELWYPIDAATASFGQGISVTPLQILDAFSAIANQGKRMEPHVVDTIETSDRQTIVIPSKVLSEPISSKTAKIMTEMLVNAVEKGEAQWVKLKGYRIAGKTGTAQIPIAGKYDLTKTIASFIGFGPADNPKFSMIVIIDRPTTSIYGAETAAPVFFDITKGLLSYYNIPPTNE